MAEHQDSPLEQSVGRDDSDNQHDTIDPVDIAVKNYNYKENDKTEVESSNVENISKRKYEDETTDSTEWVGPLPSEAFAEPSKKRKVLEFEQLYINNLPSCESYEKSYMHRDVITHVICTKTDFVITASCDGHVKFWKKTESDIEFVKHFRSHLSKLILMLL